MMKWLKKLQESLTAPQELPEDPATEFDDPLAGRTAWTPCKRGGTNFRTHKAVVVSPNRIEFRMAIGTLLFAGMFAAVGIGVLAWGIQAITAGSGDGVGWFLLAFGFIFAGAGLGTLYFYGKPRVFDKRIGCYWKGRANARMMSHRSLEEDLKAVRLEDIHALQIISEYCRSDKSSYYSYELNIVRQDGSRVNVIDHGNHNRLCDDADMIAEFLDVPIWEF